MSYTWRTVPELGDHERAGLGLDRDFPDQAAAEAWLAAFYPDLADAGVSGVVLVEEDRIVYGPMSLDL